jgi:hypothetical protein
MGSLHSRFGRMIARMAILVILGLLLGGCGTTQIQGTTQVQALQLNREGLRQHGLAFLTPSSVTGQEEDKQALALAFFEVIRKARPDLRLVSLPVALTAINTAGLAGDYRRMLDDYRATGVFDRERLRRIGDAVGVKYLAQLKLAGFRQESKSRWGTLGLRIFETKSTSVRLFLQIWDSDDGAIVWEGAVEITSAYDSMSEETVTFRSVIEECARRLVERLP